MKLPSAPAHPASHVCLEGREREITLFRLVNKIIMIIIIIENVAEVRWWHDIRFKCATQINKVISSLRTTGKTGAFNTPGEKNCYVDRNMSAYIFFFFIPAVASALGRTIYGWMLYDHLRYCEDAGWRSGSATKTFNPVLIWKGRAVKCWHGCKDTQTQMHARTSARAHTHTMSLHMHDQIWHIGRETLH